MKNVHVKVINLSKSLPLPKYETEFSAGMDVMACFDCDCPVKGYGWFTREFQEYTINSDEFIEINPGERVLIPTGLKVEIPEGYEIQVRPRSGLALKKGITILNTPGTIDSDYRGMIGIIVINHSNEIFEVNHGDKIAQIVLNEVPRIQWETSDEISKTNRGEGGFGSTGVSSKSKQVSKDRIPSFQEGDSLDGVGKIIKVDFDTISGQFIYEVEVNGDFVKMSEKEIIDIVL